MDFFHRAPLLKGQRIVVSKLKLIIYKTSISIRTKLGSDYPCDFPNKKFVPCQNSPNVLFSRWPGGNAEDY